ncbi:biopolymer transporter ExbD [Chitinivorax sp. B]|uniref:ExbD/TolR family protein n=1 Tax=Chitinivorax sp. B TaxID=2502235 RepID=UPI0010F7977C|nr:biopolymer transporter ExbD [Chitinivorax sp. B]
MNFRKGRIQEEPEINFIPLIDVLLVILIFLMVTTTYSRYAELQINLPQAEAEKPVDKPTELSIGVDANGRYVINEKQVAFSSPESFSIEMKKAAGDQKDPVVIINADAKATHQSVVNIMEAARFAGFGRITFATQSSGQ